MKAHEALLILPHQLFEHHELLEKKELLIILWQAPRYFTDFKFHKAKLVLHYASMLFYQEYLEKKKHSVIACWYEQSFHAVLKKHGIKHLHFIDPVDIPFEKQLKAELKKANASSTKHETISFLTPMALIEKEFDESDDSFRMHPFYVQQRKRLDILMHHNKPIGGSWSFDKENRKKLPASIKLPDVWQPRLNDYVKAAHKEIEKNFAKNPGSADSCIYPTTFTEAKKWLNDFLEHRFKLFGDYQDALNDEKPFLFHSLLSPLLNTGLLTPTYVVEQTLEYAKDHKTPINSVEGFIRQIIGWREYVRAIYVTHGATQRVSNFFDHSGKLTSGWWDGSTGIAPIDMTIEKVLDYGYAHHIERLMILGNFMLLSKIEPDEVYTWFMELFIDAYDWVMVPNVYGMSQYADGGFMMTKPYCSSSNYIRTMSSSFKKGPWCEIWDARYWYFLHQNQKKLSNNSRMALIYKQLERMNKEKLSDYIKIAKASFKL